MKRDIHKLAAWLEKVCQDGVALQHKILEWKQTDTTKSEPFTTLKAS